MTKDDIISLPNKSLRSKSKKVGLVTDEIKRIIDNMIKATIDWENSRDYEISVGLAAIQVDIPLRIYIVREDFDDYNNKACRVFINPEIVKKIGPEAEEPEGCLSVPNFYAKVRRHQGVKVKAINQDGKTFRVTAYGFLARILQHEADHLNGIVTVDHAKNDRNGFFRLTSEGEIEPVDYDEIEKSNILW